MRGYTEKNARFFHGFRIDNCHSTPIPVAEYMLDAARSIRPNLIVVAELFTNSQERDLEFVSRLGIHALIREAMQSHDSFALSEHVHKYGGRPIGSLVDVGSRTKLYLKPKQPHALFFDATHDNEMPAQKHTVQDTLSTAAVVGMSCCAVASVRGYDECFPRHLDLVNETRGYATTVPEDRLGIMEAKRQLNELHHKMSMEGFNEIHVHHENGVSHWH